MFKTRLQAAGQKALYIALFLFFRLGSAFPRAWAAALARPVGRLWYRLDRRHRDIACDNISAAYPEKPRAWVEQTAKRTFMHLATVALELPSLFRLKKSNLGSYVRFTGLEHAREALGSGRPVIFLTAHFGNWEILALSMAVKCGPMHVMARALDLPPLDRIISQMREHTGNTVIDKEKSARKVAALLSAKQSVGILLDQNAAPYEGVYVPFFGRTACTNKGMALFALRHRAVVVPCFSIRGAGGIYNVVVEPPIELARTGNLKNDVIENTARFNRIMEDSIRRAPEQWLWVHRRWRMLDVSEEEAARLASMPAARTP